MKTKVAVIDIGGWGGITHYTYNLMQALSAGADIDCVLITAGEYELESLPRNFKLIKVAVKDRSYRQIVAGVIAAVRNSGARVIHVQTMISARKDWILFILARLCGLRIVFTAHNVLPHEDAEKKAFFMKNAFAVIYSFSNRIIAHSNYGKNELIRVFGIPGGKISVIAHGNYLFFRTREVSRQDARERLKIPQDKKIILHFGALRRYKGVELLLEALSLLRRNRPDIMLLLAGKPMHVPEGYFEKLISGRGLEDCVIFRSEYIRAQDMPDIFFASDLVVLPYRQIDTSGSIQLAYAFSKPVIATRTGSMAEVLSENVNGLLVEPDDPDKLAQAIEKIISDPAAIERMGAASMDLAVEKFSWRAIAVKTEALYCEIAK